MNSKGSTEQENSGHLNQPASSTTRPTKAERSDYATNATSTLEGGTYVARTDFGPSVDLVVKSFQAFISFIVGVSIFGASTFTVIAGQMQDPRQLSPHARFDMQTVRVLLSIAWLCFVSALALAGFASSMLVLEQEKSPELNREWYRRWKKFGLGASLLLQTLVVAAFLFLSLALVAYVEAVGWTASGLCAGAEALVVFLWSKQYHARE